MTRAASEESDVAAPHTASAAHGLGAGVEVGRQSGHCDHHDLDREHDLPGMGLAGVHGRHVPEAR